MGDVISEKSDGEAMVRCLDWTLQFILEEVGIKEENVVFIFDKKNIVEWMYGRIGTSWELGILRNKTYLFKQIIQECGIKYMQGDRFKHRKLWEEHTVDTRNHWVLWLEKGNA
ncbi:hypothetical protein PIB30_062236 [Stylosanthes scabra]|uniref:Uncharacterized protein n=1 Tax=Stylosanthes scabra TaxID=79078 RepID=A0ABU6TLS9_9FABA|nr:hypothetical protein [Stylosanthes scabra]